jgi:heme A synthase
VKTWYLVVATTIATLLLLIVGGTVHPSGSSLACPDWPTCFGTLVPEMKGAVLFEHGHRLVATGVGAMTWAVALCLWRSRPEDPRLRWLGILAAALVLLQGLLGALTVIYRLPTAISTAHLGLALAFFGLQIYLCFRAYPCLSGAVSPKDPRRARNAFILGASAVYLQILLGAYLRHTGAGFACTDIPFCHGQLWPEMGWEQLHMIHRFMGLLLLAVLAAVGVYASRRAGSDPTVRAMSWAGPLAVLLQIGIGVWTVLTSIDWVPASVHTGMAALILATQLIGWFSLVSFGPTQVSASERNKSEADPEASASARSSA